MASLVDCLSENVIKLLRLDNSSDEDVEYDVITGLPNLLSPSSVKVPAKKIIDYKLVFQPNCSGTIKDCLSFISRKNRERIWYAFELEVEKTPPEGTIKVSVEQNKQAIVEITVTNPADVDLEFRVEYDDDELIGPNSIIVPSKKQQVYKLCFVAIKQVGIRRARITFSNEILAEFTYELLLDVQPAKPISLPLLEAALNEYSQHAFYVDNLLQTDVTFNINYVNIDCIFIMTQDQILSGSNIVEPIEPLKTLFVPARSSRLVYAVFFPNDVGKEKTGKIVFEHANIGTIEYLVCGVSTMPNEAPLLELQGLVDVSTPFSIDFRNPFTEPIQVSINLENVCSKNCIQLPQLNLKKKFQVNAKQMFNIPIILAPKEMKECRATVVVECHEKGIVWRYPIMILFVPQDSCYRECEIILEDHLGGRWRQSLIVAGRGNEVTEVLNIEGFVGQETFINFSRINLSERPLQFQAYFLDDSFNWFKINPCNGILSNDQSNDFTVYFKPEKKISLRPINLEIKTELFTLKYQIRSTISLPRDASAKSNKMNAKMILPMLRFKKKINKNENVKDGNIKDSKVSLYTTNSLKKGSTQSLLPPIYQK
ncbi:hypothetical protein ROZALSC1DRAFT_20665 [Rozella allomycis CSF55]|uniref:Uncharacterized protein n=1 Tax=Rozella allomycis (strain CSF55) TaxID=988480 RepID=A0A4P9YPS4_ROZAC|nr:hypothetical protein ROZALSC1DRAFT_20665 [Rozella allomycis CSF55]